MEIEVTTAPAGSVDAQMLAFAVSEPTSVLPQVAQELDRSLGGRLARLVETGELRGEAGQVCVTHVDGSLQAERVAAAGAGPLDELDADSLRQAAAAAAQADSRVGGTLAWALDESLKLPLDEQARAVVDGVVLGSYDPGRWKTQGPRLRSVERLVLVGGDSVASAAGRALTVAAWANRARDLSNRPPNDLTPARLADRAAEIADGFETLAVEALGPEELDELGMGAFLAVGRGSHNEPRLIVLRYDPPGAKTGIRLGLVGKAITFDTGGISLKPSLAMEEMKADMSGGGAVIEGMGAIAELGIPLSVIGVVAAAENMPGGHAFRPGDILTAMNGKTIEITNTDAEGRLVLADALWYARQHGATHIVDFATLTGAMALALGDLYSGVFGNDDAWRDLVVEAGEASGDHAWPWPLHRRYRRYVDSTFADLKNSSTLREASPVLAAAFLEEFVGEGPWAHVDMAGPAFLARSRGDYLTQRGGTGYGVRLIAELAERLA